MLSGSVTLPNVALYAAVALIAVSLRCLSIVSSFVLPWNSVLRCFHNFMANIHSSAMVVRIHWSGVKASPGRLSR